ncbi:hypothetical protein FRC09_019996 [Ceratobasidium sp. 395]|nr:hypothetical protein FRC09_019996 [Ceratobasidium sp. 395]
MACPVHVASEPPPLFVNGAVHFQAHHVGWIVSGGFTTVAVVASLWLIRKHARWYIVKPQQRRTITLASYIFYTHATSLLLIRDAYESVVLASFFALMLQYLPGPVPPPAPSRNHARRRSQSQSWSHSRSGSRATQEDIEESQPITRPDPDHPLHQSEKSQNEMSKAERRAAIHKVFHGLQMHPRPGSDKPTFKWIWPLGSIRARPRDGLSYLQYMRWGILQYCIVRPGSALAAVILNQFNLYCESSWNIVIAVSISVTVAMYCLIQLYVSIRSELKPYSPLLKLFSVKAVVFLTFWQSALLSGLASLDIIKDTEYMTAEDITIGFGALLQTFEMMCFAFLHIKAFSYHPYKRLSLSTSHNTLPSTRSQQLRNLSHAFDFTDTFKDMYHGVMYHFGRGPSKEADEACKRDARFREVFGRERVLPGGRTRGTGGGVEEGEEDESIPRSFIRTHGYRGLPTTTATDDPNEEQYRTMRAAIRPIRRPAPELNPHPLALPTPETSPTHDTPVPITLDDPPPVSVWRVQAGVKPLPPGAYIPRLPGSPSPWSGSGSQRARADSHRSQRTTGPVVMVTPPPTPPVLLPRATLPGHTNPAGGALPMVERDANVSQAGRSVNRPTIERNTALPMDGRQSTPPVVAGAHTPTPHTSPPRSRPLAPGVRLSAIPNPNARSPPRSPLHLESPRHSLLPRPPLHTRTSSGGARTSSPALSISDDMMHPPSRDDSMLARMFSARSVETGYTVLETVGGGDTESTKSASYKTAAADDDASGRSVETSGRSSGTASYRTWERAVVRTGQVVLLEQDNENGYRSVPAPSPPATADISDGELSRPSSFGSLLAPPSPARPLRHTGPTIESRKQTLQTAHEGPSTQPKTIVLPTPLSPARYPYSAWRTPAPPETRAVAWSLLQAQRPNSSESGLAGWAAGRTAMQRDGDNPVVVAAHANGSGSLSSLSNIEDRYPALSPRGPRELKAPRK